MEPIQLIVNLTCINIFWLCIEEFSVSVSLYVLFVTCVCHCFWLPNVPHHGCDLGSTMFAVCEVFLLLPTFMGWKRGFLPLIWSEFWFSQCFFWSHTVYGNLNNRCQSIGIVLLWIPVHMPLVCGLYKRTSNKIKFLIVIWEYILFVHCWLFFMHFSFPFDLDEFQNHLLWMSWRWNIPVHGKCI